MRAVVPAVTAETFRAHMARYPLMQLADVYKLAHQACFGSAHLVTDAQAARRRLLDEIAALGRGPAEPLVDPLSADGRILRVHLRPYVAAGYDPAWLGEAFVRTANTHRGTLAQFEATWSLALTLAEQGELPFAVADMTAYGARLAGEGYPAVHHSAAYEAQYAPAYRIVARELLTFLSPDV